MRDNFISSKIRQDFMNRVTAGFFHRYRGSQDRLDKSIILSFQIYLSLYILSFLSHFSERCFQFFDHRKQRQFLWINSRPTGLRQSGLKFLSRSPRSVHSASLLCLLSFYRLPAPPISSSAASYCLDSFHPPDSRYILPLFSLPLLYRILRFRL